MSDDDLQTMPIPQLAVEVRKRLDKAFETNPVAALVVGMLVGRLVREHELRNKCEEVLEFYANPENYHAIAFMADPPAGDFMNDFDEDYLDHTDLNYQRPMPGRRAREVLKPEVKTSHG